MAKQKKLEIATGTGWFLKLTSKAR